MTDDTANRFVTSARGQWAQLVEIAWYMSSQQRQRAAQSLSQAAGVGKSTLLRKMEAISQAKIAGVHKEDVIQSGQRAVLAKFVENKRKERTDEQVCLKWMVSPGTRDDANKLFWRISTLLRRRTSEELWDFMIAVFADTSDEEILHLAGEGQRAKTRG